MTTNLIEKIEFEDFGSYVRARFMNVFYFDIEKELFEKKKGNERKMLFMLSTGMENLRNGLTNHHTFYISSDSGIPLIGSNSFGIVDRNTSIIEVKPITGCNLNCIFCSVGEGVSTAKVNDFVVEAEYLADEFARLAEFKDCAVEANINPHGEPLLYSDLDILIKGISSVRNVKAISINTNGTLLSKEMIDKLCKAGLTRFNISLNAVEPKTAVKLAGSSYNVAHVTAMAEYIAKNSSAELLIAPVFVPGVNDKELPGLIELAKNLKARISIQNFLNYRLGRNPVRQMPFEKFYAVLKELEGKHKIQLIGGDFGITRTKPLPKPFRKGETVRAVIACNGRYKDERIAVAGNRSIMMQNCIKTTGSQVRVRITRNKHNIFYGKCV